MAVASSAKTVGVTAVQIAVSYSGTADNPNGTAVKADTTNTGIVYVGGPDVTVATGYPLAAGEPVSIDLLDGDEVWAIASAAAQGVRLLAAGV